MMLTGDGSDSSGGLSAAMTAEDTTVDILKTIEEILQHFEDDPDVAENNPEDVSKLCSRITDKFYPENSTAPAHSHRRYCRGDFGLLRHRCRWRKNWHEQ